MRALEFNPEEWTQEELKARQDKVQEMLKRNELGPQEQETVDSSFVASIKAAAERRKANRAPRSDKGKKRKPDLEPESQKAGVLTQEQASKLRSLTNAELKAHLALAEAERNMEKASTDVLDFVDSLTKP